jgi:hypothetical protein
VKAILHPLANGTSYCLRLPDGRVLGQVRIEKVENEWAEGPFTATAGFEVLRPLFERETQLRHDQVILRWEQAADAIEDLGIQVIAAGQGPIPMRFRVFIEGNEAILGTELAVASSVDGLASQPGSDQPLKSEIESS